MATNHSDHGRAVALFAGLAMAFFVFALQMQSKAEAFAKVTADLTASSDQAELWRKENIVPDTPIRRAQRGMKGETALRARLRELIRRQDRLANQEKQEAEGNSSEDAE